MFTCSIVEISDGQCKASTLYQVLLNVVRHERRTWFKWITGREEDEAVLVAPQRVPSELADQHILTALDGLPRQFREVVLLVDVEEFSYKEAGAMLKVPNGTVMSRLSRGRGLLREELSAVAKFYSIGLKSGEASA